MTRPACPTRLAIVLSHPTQYYSPWFRLLRARPGLDLRVFYLWKFGVEYRRDPQFQTAFKWDVDLLSGYDSEFVPNVASDPGTHHIAGLRTPELTARLAAWNPGAVLIFGYKWISHLRAIAWARRRRVPIVFRGDSHFIGRPAPGRWKLLPLRWLFRQFAAVTYVGAANRAYFETLGVPRERLFFAPHAVDDALFDPARSDHQAAAAALRASLGLGPATKVVLFAGKLVPAKRPRELLEAFLEMAPADAALVFVGEGEEKPALREIVRNAAEAAGGSGPFVRFLPFANQTEMPSRYLLADLFALPSSGLYETWGLAVNEAMRMGRPCLVSDRVGCQRDLVTHGETGWVFSANESGALRGGLAAALAGLADPSRACAIRSALATRIAGYTYARATEGLMAALASLPSG